MNSTREFLKELEEALEMSLDKKQVEQHIDYYESYITTKIKQGEKEEYIIEQLGDPRLIAKTILQGNIEKVYFDEGNTIDEDNSYNETRVFKLSFHSLPFIIITIIIVLALIWLAIRLVVPVALIILAFYLIKKIIKF